MSILLVGAGVWLTPCHVFAEATRAPSPQAAGPSATSPDATKKPTRAELGAMLKKCSEEADAKGLTPQKGKGEQRKAFRRACMLKNGVAPRK